MIIRTSRFDAMKKDPKIGLVAAALMTVFGGCDGGAERESDETPSADLVAGDPDPKTLETALQQPRFSPAPRRATADRVKALRASIIDEVGVPWRGDLFASATAASPVVTCTTTFDSPASIARIFGGWKIWGWMTKFGPGSELVRCGTGRDATADQSCMGYNEPCGSSWLEVRPEEPSVWRVFALHFDAPAYSDDKLCILVPYTELGYLVNGRCTAIPSIATQGRKYGSDVPSDWQRIDRRTSLGGSLAPFDLNGIGLRGAPIQLWFSQQDGSVWGWNQLDPNINWNFGNYVNNTTAVWIGPASAAQQTDYVFEYVTITSR